MLQSGRLSNHSLDTLLKSDPSIASNDNVQELFKCFICFEMLIEPVLAPCCSKVACRHCFQVF